MRNFSSLKSLGIFLALSSYSSFAVQDYYSISRSIRALGMGNAFYGLSNDESALFYNPAGLSLYEGSPEFMFNIKGDSSFSTIDAISTLSHGKNKEIGTLAKDLEKFQGVPLSLQAGLMPYYLSKGLAIGLLVADAKGNATLLGSGIDTNIDITAIIDTGLFIGFAGTLFHPNLHLGMNIKGIVREGGHKSYSLVDIASGTKTNINIDQVGGAGAGIDTDLGAIYEFTLPKEYGIRQFAGVSLNNLLASKFTLANPSTGGGSAPQLPRMLTLTSRTILPGFWNFHHTEAVVDLQEFSLGGQTNLDFGARKGSFWKHVNFGIELPAKWVSLRVGLRQGNISAGLGVDAKVLKLDFATYTEELDINPGRLPSRRFALRLAFGWGGGSPVIPRKKVEPKLPPPAEQLMEPAVNPVLPPPEAVPTTAPNTPVTPEAAPTSTLQPTNSALPIPPPVQAPVETKETH